MIDSGAQCCCCPKDYAPECPLLPLQGRSLPELRTVTGTPVHVYGVKYVDYVLTKKESMVVKYYVTDVHSCVIAANGLNYVGYNSVLSN